MKKTMAVIVASVLIALAGPVSAVEQGANEKELCILYARDCADRIYNLQEKIRSIQGELAKGATVYRAEEIRKLKDKLKEAEDLMYQLTPAPGEEVKK